VGNSVPKGRRVVFVAGHGYFRLPKATAERIKRFDLTGELRGDRWLPLENTEDFCQIGAVNKFEDLIICQ
jgi:hypothetical protein